MEDIFNGERQATVADGYDSHADAVLFEGDGQVLPSNPAAAVRGPRQIVKRGKTPVLTAAEARGLLESIDSTTLIGLRDRALLGLLVYGFARVSAALAMRVADYYTQGKRSFFRLHEKGG